MIHKFSQFINENRANAVSVNDAINEPVADFINRMQERTEIFIERIQELVSEMDKAIETVMEEFGDVIIDEPKFDIDRKLWDISVTFNTNVPNNDEAWETDESPASALEERLSYWMDSKTVRSEISARPNEDGNCIIRLQTYVLDEDNFGEFADAIAKMGDEY